MNDTSLMKKVDSNTTPDSSDLCNNEFKIDQNTDDHEDERVVLANLISNLKLDIDDNKKIQKQLKNANTSLTHELKECKSTLEETNRTLRESIYSTIGIKSHEVMSTSTYDDSESITQADGAQSSRVPVPLPDDPYVAVRQEKLVDTKSEPKEAPSETKELQSLGSRVPLMGEEFEAVEPSSTRTDSSHSFASSDFTTPLSPDHPLTHILPTPTPTRASFHHRTTHTDSEGDELGDKDIEEDESLDADDESEGQGLDNKGQGLDDEGQGLDDEGHGLKDEGPSLDGSEEEAIPGVSSKQPRLWIQPRITLGTWVDPEDGRVYTDVLAYTPPVAPVQTPPSLEWSSGSFPISPSSPLVPSPINSLVATLTATISVDKDQFIEIRAQDVRELYTRSRAVRGHVDTQMADMSWAGYDDHRLVYDMLVQQATMQRELQEIRGRITALKQERDRKE
ncbi:hypothetical protein Tco_0246630 [Tanacetum coccineum]